MCALEEFLSNKARTQAEAVKIRNLGLGAIFKNEIRRPVRQSREN